MAAQIAAMIGEGLKSLGGLYQKIGGTDFLLSGLVGGTDAMQLTAIEKFLDSSTIRKMLPKEVDLKAEEFGAFGSIRYWDRIYKVLKDSNQALGIAGVLGKNMEGVMQRVSEEFIAIGGSAEDLAKTQSEFINQTSANRIISDEDLTRMATMRKAFGEGFETIFATIFSF